MNTVMIAESTSTIERAHIMPLSPYPQSFFDMYARETWQLTPDIAEYLRSNKTIQRALRYACNKGVSDEVRKEFIKNKNL